jgi:hypothetical protein
MAHVIPFYIPASFSPRKSCHKSRSKVIAIDSKAVKTSKSTSFWVALEKMFPERPQTQG